MYLCPFQWRWAPFVFILYRVLSAGFALSTLLWTSITLSEFYICDRFCFMTTWAYLLLTIYLVFSAGVTLVCTSANRHGCFKYPRNAEERQTEFSPRELREVSVPKGTQSSSLEQEQEDVTARQTQRNATPSDIQTSVGSNQEQSTTVERITTVPNQTAWYLKVMWMLFTTCFNVALFVTIMHFAAFYPVLSSGNISAANLFLRGLNSVLIFLDICLCAIPVRLLHVIYPFLFSLAYVVFTVILWATDHSIVLYGRLLDWNYPGTTIGVVAGCLFVIIPIVHLLVFAIYKIRSVIYWKLYA